MLIPEEAANTIYNLSRILVLSGSIAGLIGSLGWFWAGSARDQHHALNAADQVAEASKVAGKWAQEAVQHRQKLAQLDRPQRALPPRSISNEQSLAIIERIKFLAKAPIRIAYDAENPETNAFGSRLMKILADGGFTITKLPADTPINEPGLNVIVGKADAPPDGAMELLAVLNDLGLLCNGIANNTDDMTDIFLEVGPNTAPIP